jgi:hypothetical protein
MSHQPPNGPDERAVEAALDASLTDPQTLERALHTQVAVLVTPAALARAKARLEAAQASAGRSSSALAAAVYQLVTSAQWRTTEKLANVVIQADGRFDAERAAAAEGMGTLVNAPTWGDTRWVVAERYDIPLSDSALDLLRANIVQRRTAGQADSAVNFERHLRLLQRACDEGLAAAFAALFEELREEDGEYQVADDGDSDASADLPPDARDLVSQLDELTQLEDMRARIALLERFLTLVSRLEHASIWATLHVDSGDALAQNRLGDRRAEFTHALTSYDAVLLEYHREMAPAQWALIQNNRGNVLGDLANLLNGEVRLAELRDAVVCHDAALEMRTHQTAPARRAAFDQRRPEPMARGFSPSGRLRRARAFCFSRGEGRYRVTPGDSGAGELGCAR